MKAARVLFLLVLAVASSAALAAVLEGSGTPATEQRRVAGYTGVALALPAHVELVQGDTEGVALTADDNLIRDIETVVEGGVLKLRMRSGADVRFRSPVRAVVRVRSLDWLAIAGSGVMVAPRLNARRLGVSIAGSGDVRLQDVKADEVDAKIKGSGEFSAAGLAEAFQAHVAGSGNVKAGKLQAARASVTIAGSGDVTVWARETLDARISGSGDVRYYGEPRVERRIGGSGSVRRAGAAPT